LKLKIGKVHQLLFGRVPRGARGLKLCPHGYVHGSPSRVPRGARGLKRLDTGGDRALNPVASRAGRVD